MNEIEFCHEHSSIYFEALETFRILTDLGRTHHRLLSGDTRRHARRLLEHAATASDAPSVAIRLQALRFAKVSAVKLCVAIEAAFIEQQLSDEGRSVARRQLGRVLAQLEGARPVDQQPPSSEGGTAAVSAGAAQVSDGGPSNAPAVETPSLPAVDEPERATDGQPLELAQMPHVGTS